MDGYSETLDVRYMTPYSSGGRRGRGAPGACCDVTSDMTLPTSHQLPLQCGAAMHQRHSVTSHRSASYRSSGDDDDDDDYEETHHRYSGGAYERDGVGGIDCRGGGGGGRYRGYAQRSEWVTLSKTILMQLVERICQLSFQVRNIVSFRIHH